MNFKVGDRVRVNGIVNGIKFKDERGIIITIGGTTPPVGIKFDRDVSGHDCGGDSSVEMGYGYYVNENNLTKDIKEEIIYD